MTKTSEDPPIARPAHRKLWRRFLRWIGTLWPHWPMALALMAAGAANVLRSLQFDLLPFGQFSPHMELERSLAILGNSTQAILGFGFIFVGFGLLRRLLA
ncbi:MAG: hypothetical protein P8165_14245, partial [Deltaproteobacteria bacterium]